MIIKFYSKDETYERFQTNEEHIMEDYIGESKINIMDLLNLTGSKDEYEGFFHIMKKGESCGQINLKVNFSSDLKNGLNAGEFKYFKHTINTTSINMNNNINPNTLNKDDKIQPNKSVVIPSTSKSYQFKPKEENYTNYESNYSSEQLWNILNNNLVILPLNYLG